MGRVTLANNKTYFKCCLCEEFFEGYGNNPDPIKDTRRILNGEWFDEAEECCNNCNNTVVMQARFKEMGVG